jgi:Arc/MetJ-type ribon-helix-helix transcriptional regulator
MLDVAQTITIRTDPEIDRALATLTADGRSRSEAVRAAILAAERAAEQAALRAEAERLAADPAERAFSKAMAAEVEELRAW